MYVSMNPKGETGKVIHISQNDTNREVEFIPYDQNGLTPLTDGQLMARINSIKGNTISFNQLVVGDMSETPSVTGGSISVSGGIATFLATAQNQQAYILFNVNANHKYFCSVTYKSTSSSVGLRALANTKFGIASNDYQTVNGIYSSAISTTTSVGVRDERSSDFDNIYIKYFMAIDLTLMGIDTYTVSQVEEYLSTHLGNIPYFDSGYRLISFNGTGLKTVGFNQWDEEWELGTYSISTGNKTSSSENIRSKNKIRIFPNTVYYAQFSLGSMNAICFYDANETYLGSSYAIGKNTAGTFTSPSNAYYLTFQMNSTYGTIYNNDICINISDASKNGTYEPYTSNTLSLPTQTYFPFGDDGVGTVRDELIPNTDVYKRMGIVDLGNLTYFIENDYFVAVIPNIKQNPYTSTTLKCARYITSPTTLANLPDKSIRYYGNSNKIIIKDSSYNTTSALQSSLQGTYLVYELATPLHNYGVVDLGDLSWEYVPSGTPYFRTVQGTFPYLIKRPTSSSVVADMVCKDYLVTAQSTFQNINKSIAYFYSSSSDTESRLIAYDTDYTDATAFTNSLQGKYLLFELTTPVAPSSIDLTYPIWNGGTEQILPINDSTPDTAPIKANITYPDRTEDTEFLYKQTSFEWICKNWAFVCKNITQALSVVGNALKGTIPGTMTSESGKFPLKLKMTDDDGVCFSEKIDLFVERKP